MSTMPRIDVVIPMHNSARWVEGALNSLLQQEHCLGQVICVDNNCTDSTGEVVQTWAKAHPHVGIKVIEEPAPGACAARNADPRGGNGMGPVFGFRRHVGPHKMGTQMTLGQDHDLVYGHFSFAGKQNLAFLVHEHRPCCRPRPRPAGPSNPACFGLNRFERWVDGMRGCQARKSTI